MYKKQEQTLVRRSRSVQTITKKTRREPKKTWLETIKNDLKICNLIEEIALNRVRERIFGT